MPASRAADPWLAIGTDTLTEAIPASMQTSAAGIEITPDGEVSIGPEFRALEAAWIAGIAAMAQAGALIIVDEVFLGGPASQQRWKTALGAPDILAVQEIQDDDGATDDGMVAANVTISDLVAAIVAAGGPAYAWTEIDPVNDQDGGQPGGNIRQVTMYRTDVGLAFEPSPSTTTSTPSSRTTRTSAATSRRCCGPRSSGCSRSS